MSIRIQTRDSWIGQLGKKWVLLSLLFGVITGCATAAPQPVDATPSAPPVEATRSVDPTTAPPTVEAALPAGWETRSGSAGQGQCGYTISHPAEMEGVSQGPYNWLFNYTTTEPNGPVPNFIFVSVIPADFQGGPGEIYNYDPAATQTLLGLQVGESKSVHPVTDMAPSFTYTRLPDKTLSSQAAQAYENTRPWEFPPGTKEIRYYLQAQSCTYLIGGYMATVGSDQPGSIDEGLFEQIIATFRLAP